MLVFADLLTQTIANKKRYVYWDYVVSCTLVQKRTWRGLSRGLKLEKLILNKM